MSSPNTTYEHEVHRQLRDAHGALHGVAAFASLLAGNMQTLGLVQVGLATPRDLASAGDATRGLFAALHAWLHPAPCATC